MTTDPWFKALATEAPLADGRAGTDCAMLAASVYALARGEWPMNEVPPDVVEACEKLVVEAEALGDSFRQVGMLLVKHLGAAPDALTPEEAEQADLLARSAHRPPPGG